MIPVFSAPIDNALKYYQRRERILARKAARKAARATIQKPQITKSTDAVKDLAELVTPIQRIKFSFSS